MALFRSRPMSSIQYVDDNVKISTSLADLGVEAIPTEPNSSVLSPKELNKLTTGPDNESKTWLGMFLRKKEKAA